MNDFQWSTINETNDWTGQVRTRHLRRFSDDRRLNRVYVEVYELAGRLYWSANIYIAYRPDLSRLAFGTYPAIPGALPVAKARATRLAKAAIKASNRHRHPKNII